MNRFQRWYFAWAAPHYARMKPDLRAQAERIDCFLYSRRGIRFWSAAGVAVAATVGAMRWGGFSWIESVLLALLAWLALGSSLLGAWLRPETFAPRNLWRITPVAIFLGYLGSIVGFVTQLLIDKGWPDTQGWWAAIEKIHRSALPVVTGVVLLMVVMMAAVAAVRYWQRERELAALRLLSVNEAAARQVAETRLQLLQAQIEPHFIFNTLAAVQHWVDTADPRAGPLLRSLTSFLRASTELLGRDEIHLADELPVLTEYLRIMQARIGARLTFTLSIDAAAQSQVLPPGLALTLVENAVEHGVCGALRGGEVDICARRIGDSDSDCCGVGDFVLAIRNRGEPLAPDWKDGLGLANSRERLRHRFGDRARLTLGREGEFTVAELRIAAVAEELP